MSKPRYRVWYIPCVPATEEDYQHFEVNTVDEAKKKLKELIERDLKDDSITDNAMGLEEYDPCDREYYEWYDDYGDDIHTVMDNELRRRA